MAYKATKNPGVGQGVGGGKPRIVFTEEQITQVEALAAFLNYEQIADYFGINHDTFTEIKNRQPDVSRAYKKGKSKAIGMVAKTLMDKAREGDTTAIIFFLKTQAGWSTSENKNSIKSKLNLSKNKSSLEIIDSALTSLDNGELTVQEANQIASLAHIRANIKSNEVTETQAAPVRLTREELREEIALLKELKGLMPEDDTNQSTEN